MAIRTPGNPIVRRLGVSLPRLRGIKREGGPAATGIDQFWNAENVLPRGELVPRPGQAKLNGALLPGMTAGEFFNGMFDESVAGASVGGCGGGGGADMSSGGGMGEPGSPGGPGGPPGPGSGSVSAGARIYWTKIIDPGAAPDIHYLMFSNGGTPQRTDISSLFVPPDPPPPSYPKFVWPDNFMQNVFWKGEVWWPTRDDNGGALGTHGWGLMSHPPAVGAYRPMPVHKLWVPYTVTSAEPNLYHQINGMTVWRDKLCFVLDRWDSGSTLAQLVYEFDGVALNQLDSSPSYGGGGARLMGFMGYLYVAYFDGAGVVRRITPAGTAISMTGPLPTFQPSKWGQAWAEYKGKLYLFGQEGSASEVWSTTEGATALTRDLTTASTTRRSPVVFNNYLYYMVGSSKVGRFDGTTWDDNHATMTTGDATDPPNYEQLYVYLDSLVATPSSVAADGIGTRARRSSGVNTNSVPWDPFPGQPQGTPPPDHIPRLALVVPD